MSAPLRAAVEADGAGLAMTKGDWFQRVPAADLPKWISLYRRLRERDGGKYAQHYAQPVEALEAAARKAGIALPPNPKPEAKCK
jgi:hypothetical protein